MDGLYGSVLKAYNELKTDRGAGMRLEYIVLENERVRVDARFDEKGAVNSLSVGAFTKREGALEEALFEYGGRNFTFAMQKKNKWEDIFRIKVKQGRFLYDTIDSELPEKMNKDEANAAMEVLDVIGIGYRRKSDGSPSVRGARWHRELGPGEVRAALDTLSSRQHYHHYIFTRGKKDTSVYAREGNRVLVGMDFDMKTKESEKEMKIDELQSFMERDPDCRCDWLKVIHKTYKILS